MAVELSECNPYHSAKNDVSQVVFFS